VVKVIHQSNWITLFALLLVNFYIGTLDTTSDEVDKNVRNEVLSTLSGTTKIFKCTITYVAGFVARKSLKLMGNCRICSNILLFSDGSQINDDFVSARQYSNTSR
jgi:hypothetical protein